VGNLLVLIPTNDHDFLAYVLDREDDIEEIQAALGVRPFEHWGIYRHGAAAEETEDECLDRQFRQFAADIVEFPPGQVFSEATRQGLRDCLEGFDGLYPDDGLIRCVRAEYQLFRMVERQICQSEIARVFRNVDDFLQTAARIMNRRKARAGRSLENHVDYFLTHSRIPHVMRPHIDGEPDIVIPSEQAYRDRAYPVDRLFVVGVKTTCKDRWRQVLNEARRVPRKHIFTIQPGISPNQLRQMHQASVTLIVPRPLHSDYAVPRNMAILTLERFIADVRRRLG